MNVEITDRPSPNHGPRRRGGAIDMLVLHYTGMKTAEDALARMCDPGVHVSAHYCVDEDGTVYRLVDEARRAWHAGESSWAGERDVNSRSIGIELVNPGHEFGYRAYPEAQMSALVDLARDVVTRHAIAPARVLGHSDVAPRRKQDPGELFDWARLAGEGIGLWPGEAADGGRVAAGELQAMLGRFGYEVPRTGAFDDGTREIVAAFQRHFRPARFDGEPDAETVGRLGALLAQAG